MAVVFSKLPDNFSSVCGELVYTLSGVGAGEVADIGIVRSGDTLPLGVKRFKGGRDIDVNVSCYAKRCMCPKPVTSEILNFLQDAGRMVKLNLKCAEVISSGKIFTCATRILSNYEWLTSLPQKRSISWTDRDEISFVVPTENMFSYSITLTGSSTYKHTSGRKMMPEGIVSFSLVMSDVITKLETAGYRKGDFDSMRLSIERGVINIALVEYSIVERTPDSVRLCWLNTLGAIDYHTFIGSVKERIKVSKNSVVNGGESQSHIEEVDSSLEVTSGYLPVQWVSELAEVLSSPFVWRVEGADFFPIEVLPADVELMSGSLNVLTFVIRDAVKMKIQKF